MEFQKDLVNLILYLTPSNGRNSKPTAFCGSNVLFFGHPAGWLELGRSEKLSCRDFWEPGGGLSAPTGAWVIKALQRNVRGEQRHLLWRSLEECHAPSKRMPFVTWDLKGSKQLKGKWDGEQGVNLCLNSTVTHNLQMQQQQPRKSLWILDC